MTYLVDELREEMKLWQVILTSCCFLKLGFNQRVCFVVAVNYQQCFDVLNR
jgi:hypothetical protein